MTADKHKHDMLPRIFYFIDTRSIMLIFFIKKGKDINLGSSLMISKWTRLLPRKRKKDVDRSVRYIVSSAYKNVPFYRQLFSQAGIDPLSVRGVDDLPKLPITTRLDLMAGGPTQYLRQGISPEQLIIRHTTGTTGTPVIIHKNRMEEAFRKLTIIDAYRRNVSLTCPMTLVDVGPERKDSSTEIFKRMGPITIVRLFRVMPMEEKIDILMRIKPTVMAGRPSVFWDLINALREKEIVSPAPRLITCGAEMLFPHVRTQIENYFHCRVADYYNCEEVGNLAWECPANPGLMHPNTATGWIEAVDQQGDPSPIGGEGRLIITNLYNSSMPFIRYEMGDRGTMLEPGRCQCGFNGPVMRLMEGRCENYIVLPDGREITPRIIYEVVNSAFPHDTPGWSMIEAIRTFQIIQEANDLIVIKAVPGPAYSESLWRTVEDNIKSLHPAMRLEVVVVEDLSPEPGKKFHQVLGKLTSRWKSEKENQENK
jgi:phenylacetate-CoA ligase